MQECNPKVGILVVGIGGNNGVTMVAGMIANQKKLSWETSIGKQECNYNGCITQLEPRGKYGGVGFRGLYQLADVNKAAISGWDIRSTPLGQALYDSHVLDYDLVRQVREEMDALPVLPGVYDSSFIGESQHSTASNIVKDANTPKEKLEHIRKDIRDFKQQNCVDGHTTVIWSASVERPCETEFPTPEVLLDIIDKGEKEVSPSVLYATAAALEGCSFVNGGSQNTICPALEQLAEKNGAYCLGTDYKAGQTKFKTAAVEYIRALGLQPRLLASSNHLGNNDMLNLTSRKTLDAKMRVKHNIFEAWQEPDMDHKVCVMYTPIIGDEKRDIVEYSSQGFLGCMHTMVTYTRCMDSILCVPLMIDSAVWCDYFSRHKVAASEVAKAMAYMFKVPEGAAQGVDPGFFNQMNKLKEVLAATTDGNCTSNGPLSKRARLSENGDSVDSKVKDVLQNAVKEGIINQEVCSKLLSQLS